MWAACSQKQLVNLLWTSCGLVGPNSQWGSKNSAYCTSYSYPKCHSNGALFSQDKSIRVSRAVLVLDKIIAPPGWISNQAWNRMFWWLIQHRKAQNCNIELKMSWKVVKLYKKEKKWTCSNLNTSITLVSNVLSFYLTKSCFRILISYSWSFFNF